MEEVINYVNQSPENSNPNVLRGILQNMGDGSGGNSNLFDVLFFIGSGGTNTCSADLSDILDAITAGKHIVAFMQTDITGFEGVDANAAFTFSDASSFEAHFFVPQHTNPIIYANFHVTYDSDGVSVSMWA